MAGNESDWDETVVLDFVHLMEFTGGDPGFETHILEIFLTHAPRYIEELRMKSGDNWRITAHKLKGAARSIGAWELAREAERAESMGAVSLENPKRDTILSELTRRLGKLIEHIHERRAAL